MKHQIDRPHLLEKYSLSSLVVYKAGGTSQALRMGDMLAKTVQEKLWHSQVVGGFDQGRSTVGYGHVRHQGGGSPEARLINQLRLARKVLWGP